MQGKSNPSLVIALVALFLLQAFSMGVSNHEQTSDEYDELVEWVPFEVSADTYKDAQGVLNENIESEDRPLLANSRIGIFDAFGIELTRPIPAETMIPRNDLALLLIDDSRNMLDVRSELADISGLEVREYISPSGLVVQGTEASILQAISVPAVAATQQVPLALLIDDTVLDALLIEGGEQSLVGQSLRIEGWRDDIAPVESINLNDDFGGSMTSDVSTILPYIFSDWIKWDEGRYEGTLSNAEFLNYLSHESIRSLRFNPTFSVDNGESRNHMKVNTMTSYFTTDLDGSGQTIAVADSGLDEDHGDFGTRVVGNTDVIGDGSTADTHTGHGTHVACTVLGDGSMGGYAGVAQQADLYFQAMEQDSTGNMLSPSLNFLFNSAYNNGARIHTNSWGSKDASLQGKYTAESEDVDDRSAYYDRINSRDGMTILFAAGNEGPGTGTVSPPSTAKNSITVGNHQNRYNGAPDTIMQGSSRGPTDDDRIKPDVMAPGGYVRSCRAQEATDTAGATWSSTYYMEYTGTSMATPNAAGVSALVREYLLEIAQRPSPQGALIKALLVLGAQDMGSRDIPNNNEGFGRINLRETLAPSTGQGIWVDDRSYLGGTGSSKSYTFNITKTNARLKMVLAWSDERGSTWSTNQLVNNLNLEVTAPDGTVYLGNDMANGRSVTGGSADTINNVELVLVDGAGMGIWTVKVTDAYHGGSKSQPFALAVMGHGVNDLRPDPTYVENSFTMDTTIPQVGEDVQLTNRVFNFGNVHANHFDVTLEADGVEISTQRLELGAGAQRNLFWTWTPTTAGQVTLAFIIDSGDELEEILENNNRQEVFVNVTAPGVKLSSAGQQVILEDSQVSTTSWNVSLQNTALISTNASMQVLGVNNIQDLTERQWYVGMTEANHTLEGQEETFITVTMVHPTPPEPGTYRVDLLGMDVDNGVTFPYYLDLVVPTLPNVNVEYDYQYVPVSPIEPTSMELRLFNLGNDDIGYDVFLEAPTGWRAGFDDLGSEAGASSGSTGLIAKDQQKTVSITFTPPQVMTSAGSEKLVKLTVISQTETPVSYVYEIPIKVIEMKEIEIGLESNLGKQRPDSSVSLIFSVENTGNAELELTPTFQLPSGWQVTSGSTPFVVQWTDSKNIIVSLEGDGNAKSGPFKMHLDNGSTRFTWEGQLDVELLAQPSLDFVSLEFEDGSTFSHPLADGSHPSGQAMNFTWLVSNAADTTWNADVSLTLDDGLFGDCDELPSISKNEVIPLTCQFVIANSLAPASELSFTLTLTGDDGVVYSIDQGLYVAEVKSVEWEVRRNAELKTGTESQLELELTNTGNMLLSYRVVVDTNNDADASISGNDLVNLEAGQSAIIRIDVIAHIPGENTVELSLQDASTVSNSEFELTINSVGESTGSGSSSGINSSLAIGITVLLLALAGLGLVLKRRSSEPSAPVMPMPGIVAPVVAQPISQPAQQAQAATQCWACRGPVISPMMGCPGCGARYHMSGHPGCQSGQLGACVNCNAPSSNFVQA